MSIPAGGLSPQAAMGPPLDGAYRIMAPCQPLSTSPSSGAVSSPGSTAAICGGSGTRSPRATPAAIAPGRRRTGRGTRESGATATTAPRSRTPASTPSSSRVPPAVPSRPHAPGAGRRQARAGGEAGVPADGRLRAGARGRADRAGRVVLVGENDHYKPLAVCPAPAPRGGRGRRADSWPTSRRWRGSSRRPATGATTRRWRAATRFFEEGIHWLHLANSLGPVITAVRGYRPPPARTGAGHPCQEPHGGVPLRHGRGRVALLLAPRCPRCCTGCACRSSSGRDGIITFESNGAFVGVRGRARAWPELLFPGVRDIRGYQAMYRDFAGARSAPEALRR